MDSIKEALNKLVKQQQGLVFTEFNSAMAWELGSLMVEKARNENKQIAINISVNRRRLFYHAFDQCSPDNEKWIQRKENTTYHFYNSSLYMAQYMQLRQDTIFNRYGMNPEAFAQAGGSFPITIKGVGVVGAVTISGLSQQEDHDFVVESISSFLR